MPPFFSSGETWAEKHKAPVGEYSCGMDLNTFLDGHMVALDPVDRGELLISRAEGVRGYRAAYLRRAESSLVAGIACAVLAVVLTNAWLFIAMGLMLSIVWLTVRRWRELGALPDVVPGVYANGVQLASDIFVPFTEIDAVRVHHGSVLSVDDSIAFTSSKRDMEWSLPTSIVGTEGLDAIRSLVDGGRATGDA